MDMAFVNRLLSVSMRSQGYLQSSAKKKIKKKKLLYRLLIMLNTFLQFLKSSKNIVEVNLKKFI